jgi:hypothetical protein
VTGPRRDPVPLTGPRRDQRPSSHRTGLRGRLPSRFSRMPECNCSPPGSHFLAAREGLHPASLHSGPARGDGRPRADRCVAPPAPSWSCRSRTTDRSLATSPTRSTRAGFAPGSGLAQVRTVAIPPGPLSVPRSGGKGVPDGPVGAASNTVPAVVMGARYGSIRPLPPERISSISAWSPGALVVEWQP